MSLRTFSLITHPAFIRHIEFARFQSARFEFTDAATVPRHVPLLKHCSDIGRYLGINPTVVLGVMNNIERHYRTFEFTKKSGGKRIIDAPRTYLKVFQWWILDTILATAELSPYAHGFVSGRSFVTNAKYHHGSKYVLNVDVEDFFPSIREPAVIESFLKFGYRIGVAEDLARLTCLGGRLPQGAPTSPSLANIHMTQADGELAQLAIEHSLRFTRYADDLTFSGQSRIDASIVERIQEILLKYGLRLNTRKTKFMGENQRLEVTGLVLGKEGAVLDRRFLNKLRGWYHAASESPELFLGSLERIAGSVSLLHQVGGRGTPELIIEGQRAVMRLKAIVTPVAEK